MKNLIFKIKEVEKLEKKELKIKDEIRDIISSLTRNTLADLYGKIFDDANKICCADCKSACYKTKKEAEKDKYYEGICTKETGCCSQCALYFGYNYLLQNDIRDKKINIEDLYKIGFTKEYGFFDNNNKQCMLPRKWRSKTCLTYTCIYLTKSLTKDNKRLFEQLGAHYNSKILMETIPFWIYKNIKLDKVL